MSEYLSLVRMPLSSHSLSEPGHLAWGLPLISTKGWLLTVLWLSTSEKLSLVRFPSLLSDPGHLAWDLPFDLLFDVPEFEALVSPQLLQCVMPELQ